MYTISHLEVETTNHCQLECVFCPHKNMKRKQGVMTDETFNNLVSQLKDLRVKSCYLHQIGDPLIDTKIVNRINELSKYIKKTSISTNAMLLTEDKCKELFSSNLSELTLALDSLDPQVYEHLRVGGNFDTVKKNIDNCLKIRKEYSNKSKCKVELQVIVTVNNKDEIPEYKKQYGWLDKEDWGYLRIKEFSTFAGNVNDMSPATISARRDTCKKLNNSIGIHWNGDIIMCCRVHEDQVPYLGNINEDKLIGVFNSDIYNTMRIKMKHKDFTGELNFCKKC